MAVRDILEAENRDPESLGGDQQSSKKLNQVFESYGLDYKRLKSLERKRWKTDKLRDLIIAHETISVLTLVGTGGSARVYEARCAWKEG